MGNEDRSIPAALLRSLSGKRNPAARPSGARAEVFPSELGAALSVPLLLPKVLSAGHGSLVPVCFTSAFYPFLLFFPFF